MPGRCYSCLPLQELAKNTPELPPLQPGVQAGVFLAQLRTWFSFPTYCNRISVSLGAVGHLCLATAPSYCPPPTLLEKEAGTAVLISSGLASASILSVPRAQVFPKSKLSSFWPRLQTYSLPCFPRALCDGLSPDNFCF